MKQNIPVLEWSNFFIEPAEISANHNLVKTFSDSVKKVTKKEAVISGFPSGCDMRLLIKYANTPTLIFGPGSLKQGHTVDEYIKIDELIDSTKTIALSLLNWCGIAS
jgi:acetylornithine deacetylase